jgi:hypothetical protein
MCFDQLRNAMLRFLIISSAQKKDRLRGRAFANWFEAVDDADIHGDRLDRNHRDALLNDTGFAGKVRSRVIFHCSRMRALIGDGSDFCGFRAEP